MKKCAMCSKATTSLKTLEVCQSCDDELKPLFTAAASAAKYSIPVTEDWDEEARVAAATETDIPVTENWDEEARIANRPNFFIPGKPSKKTTHRFLFGCRSCGSRDCNGHDNYIAQVASYQRQERQRRHDI